MKDDKFNIAISMIYNMELNNYLMSNVIDKLDRHISQLDHTIDIKLPETPSTDVLDFHNQHRFFDFVLPTALAGLIAGLIYSLCISISDKEKIFNSLFFSLIGMIAGLFIGAFINTLNFCINSKKATNTVNTIYKNLFYITPTRQRANSNHAKELFLSDKKIY